MGGGGYVAGPAGLAALLAGVPLVLTEADSHLGLANRLLAGRARRVCLAFPIAGREGERLPGDRAPGPTRRARGRPRERRGALRRRPRRACLLVMGGSQGARSINLCAMAAFAERPGPRLPRHPPDRPARLRGARGPAQEAPHRERYTLLAYEPDLGDCPRRLRPRPRPLGRLDLRSDGGRQAGDPGSLPARHRRSPERQRRLDGRRGGGRGDSRRRAERRAPRHRGGRLAGRRRAARGHGLGLRRPGDARCGSTVADEVLAAASALTRRRGETGHPAGCISSASGAPG